MKCYVNNPLSGIKLPTELTKENTLFYPENQMTTWQQFTSSRPVHFHIVTDSPFLVALYGQEDVLVWGASRKQWEEPGFQTRACSYSMIISKLWNNPYNIPLTIADRNATNCMGHDIVETIKET